MLPPLSSSHCLNLNLAKGKMEFVQSHDSLNGTIKLHAMSLKKILSAANDGHSLQLQQPNVPYLAVCIEINYYAYRFQNQLHFCLSSISSHRSI